MIRSFKHTGLKKFFQTGNKKGINPDHAEKLGRILDKLDIALAPRDLNLPGYQLHELIGDKAGMWAIKVSGNWRVTFIFSGNDVFDIDYIDYH